MAQSWTVPSTWVEWLRNLFADEAGPAKPISTQAKLKLEKLEERLVPAVWGLPTGHPVTVQVEGALDTITSNGSLTGGYTQLYSGTVAVYQDPSSTNQTFDEGLYTPSIYWGDGTESTGTLVNIGTNTYAVEGSHTDGINGTGHITVVLVSGANSLSATEQLVGSTHAIVGGTGVIPVEEMLNSSVFNTLGYFTDSGDSLANLAATINWGDSSTSAGTIVSLGGGTYAVEAAHDYTITNPSSIFVSITETLTGSSGTITESVSVQNVNVSLGSNTGNTTTVNNIQVASPGAGDLPTLWYNEEVGEVSPTIDLPVTINSVTDPSTFQAEYFWDGTLISTSAYNTGNYTTGQVLNLSYSAGVATDYGTNSWQIEILDTTVPHWTGPSVSGTLVYAPSEVSSPFGAGWSSSSINELYAINNYTTLGNPLAGVDIINGDGSWSYYAYNSTSSTYTSPVGDFGTLTGSPSTGWTYTATDGEVTKYNTNGMETLWTAADGDSSISATYSGTKILTYVNTDGVVNTFNYSGSQITSIVTAGQTISLTESLGSNGAYQLINLVEPDGQTITYGYNTLGEITSEQTGSMVNGWSYNTSGVLTGLSAGSGAQTVTDSITNAAQFHTFTGSGYTEGVNDTTQTLVDPLGGTYTTVFDALGNTLEQITPDGGTTTWVLNSQGLVTSEIQPIGTSVSQVYATTSFVYDTLGYETKIINPDGTSQSYVYESATGHHELISAIDANGVTTSYAYDGHDHVTLVTQAAGTSQAATQTYSYYTSGADAGLLEQVYNSNGSLQTQYSYNSGRSLTAETDYTSGTINTTQSWTYNSLGYVSDSVDNNGVTTTYTDNALGQMLTQIMAGVTQQWVYNAADQLTASIDGNGNTTSYSYDTRGDNTTQITGAGSSTPVTISYLFNANGVQNGIVDGNGNTSTDNISEFTDVETQVDTASLTTYLTYNLAGELTSEVDPNSDTTSYSYNAMGENTWMKDAAGITTQFSYDADGNLLTQIDALGTTSYQYNDYDQQIAEIDPKGITTNASYNQNQELASTTDGNGYVTEYLYNLQGESTQTIVDYGTAQAVTMSSAYDGDGNVTQSVDGAGYTTSNTFNSLDQLVKTVDGAGYTSSYAYDSDGNQTLMVMGTGATAETTSMVYDSQDRLAQSTDPDGIVTSYGYDSDGNTTLMVMGTGATAETTSYSFDKDDRQTLMVEAGTTPITTSDAYDGDSNITQEIVGSTGSMQTTSYGYDRDNYNTLMANATLTVSQSYDIDHNVTLSVQTGGTLTPQTTYYAFDKDDNPTEIITGYGTTLSETTLQGFDNDGNVTLSVNGLGQSTSYAYDGQDRLSYSVDPDLITTSYGYDGDSNTTLMVQGTGTLAQTTSFAFNGDGQATLAVQEGTTPITTTYAYNSNDQMTLQVVGSGSDAVTTSYGYNGDGQATTTVTGSGTLTQGATDFYNSLGNLTLMVQGTVTTYYAYNSVNEVTQTIEGYGTTLAETMSAAYDSHGNETLTIDAMGDTTSFTYNSDNQLIKTVSIVPGGTNSTINESYDAEGHMTTYVDPDGNTTSYVYNVDNELVAEINPLGTTSYSYNSAGEMIANIDADGGTIADVYNGDGQVTTETWMVGTTVCQTANYSYNSVGELTYAADPTGTYSYQYDSLGQKTQQIFTDASGAALTQNYTYDASGSLSQETDSQGNSLQYSYNGLGELTTEIATSSTGTIARSQFSYNANGQVAQIQDYTVASAGTAVLTINDSYDVNGNLTTEIETGSGVSVTYINSYDSDNRITSEVRNGVTTTYGYNAESEITTDDQTNSFDANGNLTNAGFTIGTYNEVVRSDGAAGTWSYYYDGVGNLVKEINQVSNVTWNYAYDFDFRLTSATERNSGGTILESGTYSYDVYGNLVAETITSGGSTITNKFAYEGGNQIYADMNSTGTITTLYDNGMGNGTLYGRIQSGTIYWIGQDYQGSVRDIFNAAGSSDLDVISYEGDGLLNTQTGAQYLGNYAYTGLRYDSLTTFYVALNRWYNTATVQWLQLDPIGVQGGLSNFRSYVGDDWTNQTDLSGLFDNADFGNQVRAMAKGNQFLTLLLNKMNAAGVDAKSYSSNWWIINDYSWEGNELLIDSDLTVQKAAETYFMAGGKKFYDDLGPGDQAIVLSMSQSDFWNNTAPRIANTGAIVAAAPDVADAALQLGNAARVGVGAAVKAAKGGSTEAPIIAASKVAPKPNTIPKNPLTTAPKNGKFCFPADTAIATEHGQKAIQDVQASDRVWAFDLVANEWKLRHVIETYQHEHDGDMVAVSVAGEEIKSTAHHPWWVVRGEALGQRPQPEHVPGNPVDFRGEGRWVDAIDLRVGDVLLLRSGEQAPITGVIVRNVQQPVYNFHVEELQCYAVGHSQVLVHNNSAEPVPLSGKVNAPNATDSVLQDAYRNLWRPEDVRPGGTISELLREASSGVPLKHLEKAKGRLTQLINRVNDTANPLSAADRAGAERVINDLKDAIRIAEGK